MVTLKRGLPKNVCTKLVKFLLNPLALKKDNFYDTIWFGIKTLWISKYYKIYPVCLDKYLVSLWKNTTVSQWCQIFNMDSKVKFAQDLDFKIQTFSISLHYFMLYVYNSLKIWFCTNHTKSIEYNTNWLNVKRYE